MAVDQALQCVTLLAAADLSAKQFFFVDINTSGQAAVAGDGAQAVGVLQNDPAAAGREASVAIGGRTKVSIGLALTAGDEVASDAAGECVPSVTGDAILGICVEGGANGDIGSIIFQPGRAATVAA